MGCRRIVLRPNASLTERQAFMLLLGIAIVMAAIAIGFAMVGAWVVLPFSGAEWLLLAFCFWVSLRNCSICEVISISEDTVRWERGRLKPEETVSFNRAWIALNRTKPPMNGYPSRLFLRSHGKEIEIGRFLIESERETLARELHKILFDNKD